MDDHYCGALSGEAEDMVEDIVISMKEEEEKTVVEEAEQVGSIVPVLPANPAPFGQCQRCGHMGEIGRCCSNCVTYYETIDSPTEDVVSETDSAIAEQLADEYCNSPLYGEDDDEDSVEDSG
jgi:hypothetical protein